MALFTILLNVIVPVFFVIGLSVFIGRIWNPDPRGLSTFIVYAFIPALAFRGIAQSDLSGGEIAGIGGVALGVSLAMAGLGLVISRWLQLERRLEGAFLVSVILMNAANYGIPVNQFAFGDGGAERALMFYVMSSLFGSPLGVFFASRGSVSWRRAALNVLKVPITWAALAGLLVNIVNVALPLPMERAVGILADAAVPGMLALLGLQLARARIGGRWGLIALASAFRLLIGPCVALPLATLFQLSGVTWQVAIVQSAMPTAVLANALATEFGSDAEFTAAVTLLGTLASIFTLSILLALVGGAGIS